MYLSDCKLKKTDEYFIVTKGTIHKEDKIIINMYTYKKVREMYKVKSIKNIRKHRENLNSDFHLPFKKINNQKING